MRNPTRRSKNIGKTQGGRVKNGRPEEKWSRLFPENEWWTISREDRKWQFFQENPSRDFYHPCKPEEYLDVLNRLPERHTENIKGIILRRTTTRDHNLGIEAMKRFSCVIMNSFPQKRVYVFEKKPTESTIKHYEPFCKTWLSKNGVWHLSWSKEEVKKYYLYHLFLHEIGHIYDVQQSSRTKRENYAESFARDMAEWLGEI
jgi:hypothetical protein